MQQNNCLAAKFSHYYYGEYRVGNTLVMMQSCRRGDKMGPPTLIRKHLFGCCQQRKTKHFLPKKPIQGNSWCSLKKLFFGCHLKAVDFLVESSLDYLGSAFSLTNFRSLLLCSGLSIRGCIRERNTYWIILPRNKRQYGQYLALKRPYLLSDIFPPEANLLLLYD